MALDGDVWYTSISNTAGNTNISGGYYDTFGVWHPYSNTLYWNLLPTTIYKYQIVCPKKSCQTSNWLEIDKITPCTKCGAKLKAVMESADYEVPVTP